MSSNGCCILGMSASKINLSLLNAHLICGLCGGYLIDATVLTNCVHAFCRSCILRYILDNKVCPLCDSLIHEGRPGFALRPDITLQRVVYKLVPGLLRVELDRIVAFRARFSQNPTAVLKKVSKQLTKMKSPTTFDALNANTLSSESFGGDLSSPVPTALGTRSLSKGLSMPTKYSGHLSPWSSLHSIYSEEPYCCLIGVDEHLSVSLTHITTSITPQKSHPSKTGLILSYSPFALYSSSSTIQCPFAPFSETSETVYLLCPAQFTVSQLQRLLLAKYQLESYHRTVDIFLGREYLEPAHTLRELAFLYAWPTKQEVLPLLFRFSDLDTAWWGSPMPRLEPLKLATLPSPQSSVSLKYEESNNATKTTPVETAVDPVTTRIKRRRTS
ncbi:unnamed protein product [Schistocephalus solidus]|uniref:RING-type domain-containing protein n=1 Tax=Schistocephalus solidus TaxID=70667 RepID=A0A3P7CJZ5_SCHSO|nr:unnamed protein product [Schistocephalus solidus]